MIVTHLTPVGGSMLLGDVLRLGDNRRVAAIELGGPRMPRAEMDGTVSREKRDGSGGRVSLPDHR